MCLAHFLHIFCTVVAFMRRRVYQSVHGKVDNFMCNCMYKKFSFIQMTSGPEAEPPILKREPNPQVS